MKKKILLTVSAVVLIVLAVLLAAKIRFNKTHVLIGTEYIPCDTRELTLSGQELPDRDLLLRLTDLRKLDVRSVPLSIAEYGHLFLDFPNCEILWNVPFQGSYLPEDTQQLTITTLSDEDFTAIGFLPELRYVDATGCRDYETLMDFREMYSYIEVSYTVPLSGKEYPHDTTRLELKDAEISEVSAAIPYLTQLQEISFTGTAPDSEAIYELMTSHPSVSFQWELEVCGVKTSNQAETLILSGIPMKDTSGIEASLKYFPNLKRVEMCDCGISSEEMDALSQKYPDIRFVWTIKVRDGSLRTDAIAFIPFKLGYDLDKPLNDGDLKELKYCTDLVCLDLGHMKIRDVSFLQHMPNMKYLVLVDMPCKDFSVLANLKELIYLELFNVQFSQHEVLLELTKLEDLNISSTPTRDIEVLKQMTHLKRLWLVRTKLNGSQIKQLQEALPNTQIVINALHSTDAGWRNNDNYRAMRDLLGMFYMD